MLLGTHAMTPRLCAECTATGRRSRATFTDWCLITPWRRRSMTVRSPSRACQVGMDVTLVLAVPPFGSSKSRFYVFITCYFKGWKPNSQRSWQKDVILRQSLMFESTVIWDPARKSRQNSGSCRASILQQSCALQCHLHSLLLSWLYKRPGAWGVVILLPTFRGIIFLSSSVLPFLWQQESKKIAK